MIRAVLDTNVLVSGFVGFERGTAAPAQVLHLWLNRAFDLLLSEHVLDEVFRSFGKPYFRQRRTPEQVSQALTVLRQAGTVVPITAHVQGVASHPEDDLVLATAISGRAEYLVTGDAGLRAVGAYQGVMVVSPRRFLEILQQHATQPQLTERGMPPDAEHAAPSDVERR